MKFSYIGKTHGKTFFHNFDIAFGLFDLELLQLLKGRFYLSSVWQAVQKGKGYDLTESIK